MWPTKACQLFRNCLVKTKAIIQDQVCSERQVRLRWGRKVVCVGIWMGGSEEQTGNSRLGKTVYKESQY